MKLVQRPPPPVIQVPTAAALVPAPPPAPKPQRQFRPVPPVAPNPKGCVRDDSGETGTVFIDSIPAASVYRGDQLLGMTPLGRIELPSGCVELRVVALESKFEKTVRIDVEARALRRFRIQLE